MQHSDKQFYLFVSSTFQALTLLHANRCVRHNTKIYAKHTQKDDKHVRYLLNL